MVTTTERHIMRMYKGWVIDRIHPSGYWRATNYSDGYRPLMADTLAGIKESITETMEEVGK